MARPRVVAPLLAALVGAGLTVAVGFLPFLRFAYRSENVHVATETAATLVAGFAAFLVIGRVRAHGRRSDVLLASSLAVLAGANLLFALVPALDSSGPPAWADWAALAGRLLGNVLFAAAAFASPTPCRRPAAALRRALLAAGAAVGAAGLVLALLAERLPPAITPGASPEGSAGPLVAGHPAVVVVQLGSAVLLLAAAAGYSLGAAWRGSALGTALAVAAMFGAAARVNYALFPSVYSEWVYTGDLLRLAFYGVLLLAVVREIRDYWHRLAEAAVLDERRRLARDLHDGLAQELAYVVRHAPELTPTQIRHAAGRALDESRQAISALTRPPGERLDVALAVAAEEAARREGGRVVLRLSPVATADAAASEALVKVAREAVGNALRHAGVDVVTLEVAPSPLRLVVADTGCGFDPALARQGFGLASMRERIERIGGTFSIRSAPGVGTSVEAVVA